MEYLTPEMIAGEAPGIRLDSWVHENVMIVPPLFAYTKAGGPNVDYYPEGHRERIAISDRALAEKVPQYSTDIAAAWKVVETINSRGWPFCIQLKEDGRVIAESRSTESNCSEQFQDGVYYSTVPEAICKAALLVMVNNEKKN